jgi:hypothetical protein
MITAKSVQTAIAALRYHNRMKATSDPDYLDSSLEADTLAAISNLSDLHKRMTESNRSDFIGGEI